MVIYKNYDMETYKKMLSLPFNSTLGYNDEELLNDFINSQTKAVTYWGLTQKSVKENLFPLLDKANLGHTVFLMITMAENGGAGNWINHFQYDYSSNPWECAQQDIDYILSCFNSPQPLCTSAYECIKPWQEDTPGVAQGVLSSLSNTSIGAYYMVATFAGNAWTYATKWCEQNQGPKPPAIYFDNPYDHLIAVLNEKVPDWKENGGGSSNPNPSKPNPKPERPSEKPPVIEKPTESFPVLSKNYFSRSVGTFHQLNTNIMLMMTNDGLIPMVEKKKSSNGNDTENEDSKPKPPSQPNPPAGGGNGSGAGSGEPADGEVWEYVQTLLGKNVGAGQNFGECYGLAYDIVKHFTGFELVGGMNAKDIWKDYPWGQGALSGWISRECKDQNGSELRRGDIVCIVGTGYGIGGGYINMTFGHVVVLSKVANGQLEWIDQNKYGHHEVVQLEPISETEVNPYHITGYIRKVK